MANNDYRFIETNALPTVAAMRPEAKTLLQLFGTASDDTKAELAMFLDDVPANHPAAKQMRLEIAHILNDHKEIRAAALTETASNLEISFASRPGPKTPAASAGPKPSGTGA